MGSVKTGSDLSTSQFIRAAARLAGVPERVEVSPGVHIDGAVAALSTLKRANFDMGNVANGTVAVADAAHILKAAPELHASAGLDGRMHVQNTTEHGRIQTPGETQGVGGRYGASPEGFTPWIVNGRTWFDTPSGRDAFFQSMQEHAGEVQAVSTMNAKLAELDQEKREAARNRNWSAYDALAVATKKLARKRDHVMAETQEAMSGGTARKMGDDARALRAIGILKNEENIRKAADGRIDELSKQVEALKYQLESKSKSEARMIDELRQTKQDLAASKQGASTDSE